MTRQPGPCGHPHLIERALACISMHGPAWFPPLTPRPSQRRIAHAGDPNAMNDLASAIAEAFRLIAALDANLAEIVLLSLKVSLSGTCFAALFGLPIGALIAIAHFRGRGLAILLVNALMGLPPVVVGLLVYVMLSNAGPMGGFGLLYS